MWAGAESACSNCSAPDSLSCATLAKLLHLSEPALPHPQEVGCNFWGGGGQQEYEIRHEKPFVWGGVGRERVVAIQQAQLRFCHFNFNITLPFFFCLEQGPSLLLPPLCLLAQRPVC